MRYVITITDLSKVTPKHIKAAVITINRNIIS